MTCFVLAAVASHGGKSLNMEEEPDLHDGSVYLPNYIEKLRCDSAAIKFQSKKDQGTERSVGSTA